MCVYVCVCGAIAVPFVWKSPRHTARDSPSELSLFLFLCPSVSGLWSGCLDSLTTFPCRHNHTNLLNVAHFLSRRQMIYITLLTTCYVTVLSWQIRPTEKTSWQMFTLSLPIGHSILHCYALIFWKRKNQIEEVQKFAALEILKRKHLARNTDQNCKCIIHIKIYRPICVFARQCDHLFMAVLWHIKDRSTNHNRCFLY